MRNLIICGFLGLLILAACNSSENNSKDEPGEVADMVVKPFSDSTQTDTFRLELVGTEPRNMFLWFSITSFEGKRIYEKKIKAKDLFKNYDVKDINKKKIQIQFLKDEVGRFLDEENFMEPAVTTEEKADANVPDKIFYEELKKSQLNGFIYRLGKEQKVYIAWSDRDKKVKVYYSCCK